MREEYKDIKNYEDVYQITSYGRIYNKVLKKFRKPKYTIDIYSEIDSYLESLNIGNKGIRAYYWVDITNRNFLIGQKLGSKPDGLRCITFLYNKIGE